MSGDYAEFKTNRVTVTVAGGFPFTLINVEDALWGQERRFRQGARRRERVQRV